MKLVRFDDYLLGRGTRLVVDQKRLQHSLIFFLLFGFFVLILVSFLRVAVSLLVHEVLQHLLLLLYLYPIFAKFQSCLLLLYIKQATDAGVGLGGLYLLRLWRLGDKCVRNVGYCHQVGLILLRLAGTFITFAVSPAGALTLGDRVML